MPIKIEAQVIDLRKDTPRQSDVFFVDTNVWYWMCYPNASHPHATNSSKYNQAVDYPNYLAQVLAVPAALHKCTLSFSELMHSIEKTEWEIFKKSSPVNAIIKPKVFRHDYPLERQQVITHVINAWNIADSMTGGQSIAVQIDSPFIANLVQILPQSQVDGYDLFMAEMVRAAGITQVITDDADFGTIAGFQIFTANNFLIREAQKQHKLLVR